MIVPEGEASKWRDKPAKASVTKPWLHLRLEIIFIALVDHGLG